MSEDGAPDSSGRGESSEDELYAGLQALAESAFPKRCNNCGRSFATAAEFIAATENIPGRRSGFKATRDDDGQSIVELFRNCSCGSTLMDNFSDRRDLSEAGLKRRQRFGELLDYLVAQGLAFETARAELKKVLRGERSTILAKFRPPPSKPASGNTAGSPPQR